MKDSVIFGRCKGVDGLCVGVYGTYFLINVDDGGEDADGAVQHENGTEKEIDVAEFNQFVLDSGKRLYLPRCVKGTPEMNFHLVSGMDELSRGSFSINEPSADAPIWNEQSGVSCAVIIPAMSYDRRGYRLGYGKGYYDRYLSDKGAVKIGICYTDFIAEHIPNGRFDLAVDIIVTEKGIITVNK